MKKTGRLLVVDCSWTSCGAGAEILARLAEDPETSGNTAARRMGFAPATCPTTPSLEALFYPNPKSISSTAYALVRPDAPPWEPDPERGTLVQSSRFRGPLLGMKTRYPLADDTVDDQDIKELIGWLQSKPWLTQGSLVRQFEEGWSRWLGTQYALFVNSGSSANLLMYYAALLSGRLKNRRVIVPAIAWATTVAPAIQLGFEPILCEADWDTFGLDMETLERLLADHDPGAVIFVHTLGVPDNVGRLLELQKPAWVPAHGRRLSSPRSDVRGEARWNLRRHEHIFPLLRPSPLHPGGRFRLHRR